MKKIMFVWALFCYGQLSNVFCQSPSRGLPSPTSSIREADVMWSKRIWRVINLKEKMNLPYYYPLVSDGKHQSLFDVLKKGVFAGKIQAFESDQFDSEFSNPYSIDKFSKRVIYSDSLNVYDVDEQGNEVVSRKWVSDTLSSENVDQYWVLEEWFFDRQRSVMDFKIIGLAPVQYVEEKEAHKVLFWIYYPACRELLDSYSAINPYNRAEERTFDELFSKRFFGSYIMKEDNVYDRSINEYALGIDGLLEGEKIKTDVINYEFDLWHY